MNIRDRWIQVKTELAAEIRRVNELFKLAKDPTFCGIYVAGQFIHRDEHEAIIAQVLNVKYLEIYCNGLSVKKGCYWGENERKATHTIECVRSNCPLTLKEADQLLLALKTLTQEKMHLALDAALVAASE